MFRIIEKAEPDLSPPALELSVYTSPKDGETTLAHATYPAIIQGSKAIWPCIIRFGTPVQVAFQEATDFAKSNDIAVWVNDPQNLFPPERRKAAYTHLSLLGVG